MATAWSSLTIANAADVQKRVRDLYRLLGIDSSTEHTEVDTKITLAKARLKQHLIIHLKRIYPEKIEGFIQYARFRYARYKESWDLGYRQSGIDMITEGPAGPVDLTVDVFTNKGTGLLNPRVYYEDGTPTNGTSGTLAGTAKTGSFCIDTDNWKVYINRGTEASPTWAEFKSEDLIDYIHNPTELQEAFVSLVILFLIKDGALRSLMDTNMTADDIRGMIKTHNEDFEKNLADALQILVFDIDNDGVTSDYERSRGSNTGWA